MCFQFGNKTHMNLLLTELILKIYFVLQLNILTNSSAHVFETLGSLAPATMVEILSRLPSPVDGLLTSLESRSLFIFDSTVCIEVCDQRKVGPEKVVPCEVQTEVRGPQCGYRHCSKLFAWLCFFFHGKHLFWENMDRLSLICQAKLDPARTAQFQLDQQVQCQGHTFDDGVTEVESAETSRNQII